MTDNPFASPRPIESAKADFDWTASETLSVDYSPTVDDFVEGSIFITQRSPVYRRQIRRVRLILVATMIIAALALGSLSMDRTTMPILLGVVIVIALILAVLLPFTQRRNLRRYLRRTAAIGNNRSVFSPHRCLVSPEFLMFSSPDAEAKIRWHAVEEIHRSEDYLLIYTTSWHAKVIPLHAFLTEGHREEFEKRARRYLDQATPPPASAATA